MKISDVVGLTELEGSVPIPTHVPFTAAQAADLGVPRRVLGWLVAEGHLRHPVKNVYVNSALIDSAALRCSCLSLVMPSDCVVVDRHAAWALGSTMSLAPNEHLEPRPISVFRPAGCGRLRNELAASGERNLIDGDITMVNGLRVTTPLRTAWDLGRQRYREPALAGLDAMLRIGVDHGELLEGVDRFRGMRWVTQLRAMAPLADGLAESPGESVLRLRWLDAGLPPPTPQVPVWDGGVLLGVLDLADEDLLYAAEYDGEEWHSSDDQERHDRERRALMGQLGWDVEAFTAVNVFGRRQDAEQIMRDGIRRARLRRSHDRVGASDAPTRAEFDVQMRRLGVRR